MSTVNVRRPFVEFNGYVLYLILGKYAEGGRTSIHLVDADSGEPYCTATVNVPEEPLGPGEVIIKSYSENEGLLERMVEGGVVEPTGRIVQLGHAEAHVCRLLLVQ